MKVTGLVFDNKNKKLKETVSENTVKETVNTVKENSNTVKETKTQNTKR